MIFLDATRSSAIISANELVTREGLNLQKGMNFRDKGPLLSVFLVLPPSSGVYKDEWHEDTQTYVYEGHDSTTVESGKLVDQILMYEGGRLTDNGKFYKAANAFKDGVRTEPLQIQVYEKLDAGVWFDKGIFNLIDAKHIAEGGRKVCKFYLTPADGVRVDIDDNDFRHEQMIPTSVKVEVWKRDKGACSGCGSSTGLHYGHTIAPSAGGKSDEGNVQMLCAEHFLQKGPKTQ